MIAYKLLRSGRIAPFGHGVPGRQKPFLMPPCAPVRPMIGMHEKRGNWRQSLCTVHAGAQKPKSPAPLPCGE